MTKTAKTLYGISLVEEKSSSHMVQEQVSRNSSWTGRVQSAKIKFLFLSILEVKIFIDFHSLHLTIAPQLEPNGGSINVTVPVNIVLSSGLYIIFEVSTLKRINNSFV